MKVVCDACQAKYRLPDGQVKGKVLRVRCKRCGHVFEVRERTKVAVNPVEIKRRARRATGQHTAIPDDAAATPASKAPIWFYSINSDTFGPYQESELIDRFRSGRLGDEAYVWNESFEHWTPATEEPLFSTLITAHKGSKARAAGERNFGSSATMALSAGELRANTVSDKTDEVTSEEAPASAIASKEFSAGVDDALDQMFSGGAKATPTQPEKPEPATQAEPKAEPRAPRKPRAKSGLLQAAEDAATGPSKEEKMADLKAFLASKRTNTRKNLAETKRTAATKRRDLPEKLEGTLDSIDDAFAAATAAPFSSAQASEIHDDDDTPKLGIEVERPDLAPEANDDDNAPQSAVTPEPPSPAEPAAATTPESPDDDLALLNMELGGTGIGRHTAAMAAVEDRPILEAESTPDKRKNFALIALIGLLLLGILFLGYRVLFSGGDDDDTSDLPEARQQVNVEDMADPRAAENLSIASRQVTDRVGRALAVATTRAEHTAADRADAAQASARSNGARSNSNAAATRSAAPEGALVRGGFAAERSVTAAIDGRQNHFIRQVVRACENQQRSRGGVNMGNVSVTLRVAPTGAVESTSLNPGRSRSPGFHDCVVQRAAAFRFGPFDGPARTVSLPNIILVQ